jgi:hypothetical protein
MPDSTIFANVTQALMHALTVAMANLVPLSHGVMATLAGFAIFAAVGLWATDQGHALARLAWTVFKLQVLIAVIGRWGNISNGAVDFAAGSGLLASGNIITIAEFLNPMLLWDRATTLTAPLAILLQQVGIWASLASPHLVLSLTASSWVICLLWGIISLHVFSVLVLVKFMTLVALIGLPFVIAPQTAWIGRAILAGYLGELMRLFTLAGMTSLVLIGMPYMTMPAGQMPTFLETIGTILLSVLFLALSLAIPAIGARAFGGSTLPGAALWHASRAIGYMAIGRLMTQATRAAMGRGAPAALAPSPAPAQTVALQRATRNLAYARRRAQGE